MYFIFIAGIEYTAIGKQAALKSCCEQVSRLKKKAKPQNRLEVFKNPATLILDRVCLFGIEFGFYPCLAHKLFI